MFPVSRERFEAAVMQAIEAIPAEFQPYLEDIHFLVADDSGLRLFGLYEGAGVLAETNLPPRITLFKDTHEHFAESWQELETQVRRTLEHEIGHHFQMGEQELPH
ncbi:MAG: metallopeptidase family protein [Candidatus Dormibacter sp.]|uniref:metallopeptidase family protein n=1 Tax=Candidatus Dormibacter sp. TaxID=2973982 RepID=UPI000DAF6488|nr:MAG: hypothetical protein DLM66_02070 [Candidatus Dormibacteraeota bacterium]